MGISSNASLGSGKVPQRLIRELVNVPYFVTYQSTAVVDFGASNASILVFETPASRRGKPLQVDLYANAETFAGTTSKAAVAIGDGSDIDEFALTDDIADGTASQTFNVADGTLAVGDVEIIEPDDQVTVTAVAATGSPTGQAFVGVTMLYFE